MIKRLFVAALALIVGLTPGFALAQETGEPAPQRIRAAVDPDQTQDLDNLLYLDLSNGKRVAIRLMPDWAPNHVERIKTLTRQGFYDGVIFHRVIDGFMAQTGDPTGTGRGGSELPDLEEEFNMFPHVRGTVSMARAADENSANSQFFIVFYPRFTLDRKYTNFGRVIGGMDAVDEIHRGEPPADPTYIVQASIASDGKPQKFPETGAAGNPVLTSEELDQVAGSQATGS
ncbi:peptidylprolyl isomerase [Altererythrobacter atlanticus]|uniref:Peptidyl-prolyl cis-trans isomerase n=1 Tax=Croceibacterium atlanticum TaxID=1267766 RepID=A0A0F7KLQ8_9SPHN|nr:peptidylprolyl isomerase [Croceibacterium atlanticum]AKH41463.1 Peptidyl-prolyl cis-trans isomerase B [Croceibacterium atlanticum]MBB5732925.1 peptidylprolyl isomerase [Croceibacterium atlanticum]